MGVKTNKLRKRKSRSKSYLLVLKGQTWNRIEHEFLIIVLY